MLKKLLLIFAAVVQWTHSTAQDSGFKLYGQIQDKQSHSPIGFVHVIGSSEQVVSDQSGLFSITFQVGDTITFSHINFDRYAVRITDSGKQALIILLSPKENLMQEIIIRDYLAEEDLKREIVEREVKYSVEEVNAINNIAFSTVLYKKGYVPEMNSLDNFKNYMKEPQGITLFSSNPSKGLIRSIKKLKQQKNSFGQSELKLNRVKTDTLLINQFLTPTK
ncbi:hypothetical protein [Reichenbachiella sp.]|uniref:carboxypeptidase-like regulatory domain-containing protein n=1 Tax=Reichenbachiella sp. TaxID=2184521 RepID=UPI0032969802